VANGMRRIKLKDVCNRITVGHVGPMADKYTDEGVPFLRSQNIMPFRLNLNDIKFVPREFHEKLRKSALQPGDVAVVRTGYPGTACVIPNTFTELNCADLVVITPSRELNPYYLAAIFNSAWGVASVAGNLVGVAQQHFNIGAARELEVSIPPRSTQDRIAGILSAYDELMENSQRRIRILEAMARALYREWFVDFRFPVSSSGPEKLPRVASPLGDIPRGWELKKLGDIAENMRRNVAKGEIDEPKPYVGLEHIPRRSLALDAWETAVDLGSNKLEFKKSEVLFGKIRPYFHKVSVAPFDGLCSADTIVIRARRPEYYASVVACVSSDAFVAEASATANGAKMPRANWDVLKKYPVVIPKGKVAEQFSALFAGIIEQQQTLMFQIQNLRRTRDLLLPRLLSGAALRADAHSAEMGS
jgi:type I restriction enzyme, S subunit